MKPAIAILAALAAGCAFGISEPAPVKVTADTYCRVAAPITWSTMDTVPTIDQVRRHNGQRTRLCGRRP